MGSVKWEKFASMAICLAACAALAYFAFRYVLPILLPFAVAYLFSLAVRPLAKKLGGSSLRSQRLWSVVLLTLFLSGSVALLYLSVNRVVVELQRLLESLLSENGGLSGELLESVDLFELLTSRIGFLRRIGAGERFASFREDFNAMVGEMLGNLFNSLSASLPSFAARVVGAMPQLLLVTAVTVISGFYFCMEGDHIMGRLQLLLPSAVRRRLPTWKQRAKQLSGSYLRAYLVLLILTFAELFLGFTVLGLEYAFLLALLVAVVDLLPVFGVGTVLVPWAVIELIQKHFYLGFGLLILYFAVTVLRQILEPRLVGRSLGLHPLLTLFASYAGWSLFGFLGMIIGPLAAMLIKGLLGQLKPSGEA